MSSPSGACADRPGRLWPRPPSVDRAATLAETDAEFLVSATASRPVTCGWAWPVVLVPRTFETFPEHEQTAIATHELLHVSRADWARNAADEVLRALLWFHPGVWFVINQIQLAREQVVDREAVRRLGTRQPYLEALLRLARPAPRLVLTPASLFLKRAHLRQRVTLLVKEASMSRARLVGSLAVMAVVVFIGGRMATAAFPLQQSGAKTPGVATAAPKLTAAKIGPLDFENSSLRAVLSTFSTATGIAVTTEIPDRVLDQPITMKFATGVPVEQVLQFIATAIGGSYRVTSERSVVLTGAGGIARQQQARAPDQRRSGRRRDGRSRGWSRRCDSGRCCRRSRWRRGRRCRWGAGGWRGWRQRRGPGVRFRHGRVLRISPWRRHDERDNARPALGRRCDRHGEGLRHD